MLPEATITDVLQKPVGMIPLFVELNEIAQQSLIDSNTQNTIVDTLFTEINNADAQQLLVDMQSSADDIHLKTGKLYKLIDDVNDKLRIETDPSLIAAHKSVLDSIHAKINESSMLSSMIEAQKQQLQSDLFSANANFKLDTTLFATTPIPPANSVIGDMNMANTKSVEMDALIDMIKTDYNAIMEPDDLQEVIVPKTDIYVKFETVGSNIVPYFYSDSNYDYAYGYNFVANTIAVFDKSNYNFHIQPLDPSIPPSANTPGLNNVGISFIGHSGMGLPTVSGSPTVIDGSVLSANNTGDLAAAPVYLGGTVTIVGGNLNGYKVSDITGELKNPNGIGSNTFMTLK